jgi:predicted dehydrogenase
MALSIEDIERIIDASRKAGRIYTMMETMVYTRHFLFAEELVRSGRFGRIQFLRGTYYQDMEGWPAYWRGLPPMYYSTHAVAPILAISGTRAVETHCYASGLMREELHQNEYGSNTFPIETAIFRLVGNGYEPGDLAAEATRSMFHTAREYLESFSVYGENMSFEWEQLEGKEHPVLHTYYPPENTAPGASERGRDNRAERVEPPDYADRLPEEIGPFTKRNSFRHLSDPDREFMEGGGHDGSHPHLVHDFIRSIIEGRKPRADEVTSAEWTGAGVCAHKSAVAGGAGVKVPDFRAG